MINTAFLNILKSRYAFRGDLIERSAFPTLIIAALFITITLLGVAFGFVGYHNADINPIFFAVGVLWCCGIGLQLLGLDGLGQAVKALSCYIIISVGAVLISILLAVISRDYADSTFSWLDHILFFGFEWETHVPLMISNNFMGYILSYAYASLNWQPFFAIAYLFFVKKEQRYWKSLTATSISLMTCMIVFPLFPALGGYVHFNIPHLSVPNVMVGSAWHYPQVLQSLKSGEINYIGVESLEGIIAMPSFHAASSIILAWSFLSTRLKWPFIILNIVMLISSVPIGGHYILDVVAGSLTAISALWAAKHLHRKIDLERSSPAVAC